MAGNGRGMQGPALASSVKLLRGPASRGEHSDRDFLVLLLEGLAEAAAGGIVIASQEPLQSFREVALMMDDRQRFDPRQRMNGGG
jgi:hypothetical protein